METDRLLYAIKRRLPIFIGIGVVILAIVIVAIWKHAPDKPIEDTGQQVVGVPEKVIDKNINNVLSDGTELKEEYFLTTYTCVEVHVDGIWTDINNSPLQKIYRDNSTGLYSRWNVTLRDDAEPLETQLSTDTIYTGLDQKVSYIPFAIKDCVGEAPVLLSEGFYGITSINDGYAWIASMIDNNYALLHTTIQANCLDVYLSKAGTNYRAVITDQYIVFTTYTGAVPKNI